MNEVQQNFSQAKHNPSFKTANGNSNPGKCGILEERPQVSCISQELNRIRQWRPVEMLTTLPEHLGQSNGESRVDRLIIESLKNLKRDTRVSSKEFTFSLATRTWRRLRFWKIRDSAHKRPFPSLEYSH